MATSEAGRRAQVVEPVTPSKPLRRRRGEARLLLLEAGRTLFSDQGFTSTSTKEIADLAGVSEPLLFKWFGSKAGLFREAVVAPFVEFVEDFNAKWKDGFPPDVDDLSLARRFIGELFDLFRDNRALVVMLWAGDTQEAGELADTGLFDEINHQMELLAGMRVADIQRRSGRRTAVDVLATRTTLAMIAGMAVFGEAFYGRRPPSRRAIVESITTAAIHGHFRPPS